MASPFGGYPQAHGSKLVSVIEKTGPSSYTTVTTGTPPTGGQSVTASEFGLKYIEHVEGCLSDNGQYLVFFTPTVSGKEGVTSGILFWMTAVNGLEVVAQVDLSGRTVRLKAIGF